MSPEHVAQIVADPRLTPDAVRLVLYVGSLGSGEQEVDADTLRMLLGCKGDKPVYNARERAAKCNYLRWRQGGQKHSNRYEYLAPEGEVSEGAGANTSPPRATNPEYLAPEGEVSEPVGGTLGGGIPSGPPNPSTIIIPLRPGAPERAEEVEPIRCTAEAVKALNRGMAANELIDQRRLRPVLSNDPISYQQVTEWLAAGIPPPTIYAEVEARAKSYKPDGYGRQIHNLKYLANAVREAHARQTARDEAERGEIHERNQRVGRGTGEALRATGTDGPGAGRGAARLVKGRWVRDRG